MQLIWDQELEVSQRHKITNGTVMLVIPDELNSCFTQKMKVSFTTGNSNTSTVTYLLYAQTAFAFFGCERQPLDTI